MRTSSGPFITSSETTYSGYYGVPVLWIFPRSSPLSTLLSMRSSRLPRTTDRDIVPTTVDATGVFLSFVVISSLFQFVRFVLWAIALWDAGLWSIVYWVVTQLFSASDRGKAGVRSY